MTIVDKAARAGRVIVNFLTERGGRIRYARRNRAYVLKGQRADAPKNAPRKDWIHEQAMQVVDQLRRAATTYEARYPWDAILPEDYRDVLHSAAHLLVEDDDDEQG